MRASADALEPQGAERIVHTMWEELKGQIYPESEAFIRNTRGQSRAAKPSRQRIFGKSGKKAITEA